MARLTERQKKFCEIYASNGGNAAAAAKAAGYKNEYVVGAQNLSKLSIKEYLKELADSGKSRNENERQYRIATAKERQEFWTRVMLGEEVIGTNENGDNIHPDMKDRLKASELLGRSQADFIDRKSVVIENDLSTLDESQLKAKISQINERISKISQ